MKLQPEIQSYLKKIENELAQIDRKQKKSIVQEIEGHLFEKIDQARGSDEGELSSSEIKKIIEEFGEPEEISKEYMRQLSDEKISKRAKGKSSVKRVIFTFIAIGIVASLIIVGFVYFGGDEEKKEDAKKIIIEGKGLDEIQIGDELSKIVEVFGDPESSSETDTFIWVKYHEKNGIDFLLSKQTGKITEIRFNTGFKGNLESGITIGTDLNSVLDAYGGANKILKTNRDGSDKYIFGSDKVLYQQIGANGLISFSKFIHAEKGILFWFGPDENVTQIVVFNPYPVKYDIASKWLGEMHSGDMESKILGWLGEPEEKVLTNDTIWMVYHELAGIDFLIDNVTKEVLEVRFNEGFDFGTINQLSIGSSLTSIINANGDAEKTVKVSLHGRENLVYGVDRVLYEQIDPDNKTTAYMFINAPEGILYWFDINKTVTQIVVFQPYTSVNIKEGIGLNYVMIGDGMDKVIDLYGPPIYRVEENNTIWIAYYTDGKIDFLFNKTNQTLIEIRFNEGFEGAFDNGIIVGSFMDEVINLSGGANKTVQISADDNLNLSLGSDKVLYEIVGAGNDVIAYKFIDAKRGMLYWFDSDEKSTQIVVFDPY